MESYQEAERRFWNHTGAIPTERRVQLVRNGVEVRVQEVGEGPPVLFLHGGPGAAGASWAPLAARLPDFRCLLLDRPGTGLSDPHPLSDAAAVRREAETLVADVLDGLGLDRAHLVGSSHGSFVALLSSATHPDRVGRTVHCGCPGFIEGMVLTAWDRLMLLPGAAGLFARFPASEKSFRKTMRQLGHGASLDAGSLPDGFIDLSLALQRHTETMRNELSSIAAMGSFRQGFHPSLTVGPEQLAAVSSPTHVLWGSDEVYADAEAAKELVAALPTAELEILPAAGHLCWLDDPAAAADVVRRHLLA